MPTVARFVSLLAERTRPENAAAWDPVGLQLGDPEAEVNRVGICHEVNSQVIARLEQTPVDLLVSYHPLLFEATNRLVAGRSPEARAMALLRGGSSLVITHTDFDVCDGGAADSLAQALDLSHVEAFGADEALEIPAIGRVGGFGQTLHALDAMVTDLFGVAGLRVSGDRSSRLERVAVVPGSGSDLISAAAEVADALVTGDVSHHRAVAARDLGLAIVDPGHIATERPGMASLVGIISALGEAEVVDLTDIDPATWS